MKTLKRTSRRRKNRESRKLVTDKSIKKRSEKIRKVSVNKYNIYIICKDEESFLKRSQPLQKKYKSKICNIQWIPAEYLTLTQCNKSLLKKLKTLHNTKQKRIMATLGVIAAHRKALLSIYSNQTDNNIILEDDALLMNALPLPPKKSCFIGGWIIPPKITQIGKVKLNIKPKKGLNKIDFDTFKILCSHSLFIKTHEEATKLLDMTIQPEKLKNYGIFLSDTKFFDSYYYPSLFVQEQTIEGNKVVKNKRNYGRTYNYGL